MEDERDLGIEQKRLCELIDRFVAAGPGAAPRIRIVSSDDSRRRNGRY